MCFQHRARYRGSLNCGSRARRKIGFVSAWTTFPPFLLLLVVSFAMCAGHGINTSRVAVAIATGTRYLCVKEEMIGPNRTNVVYIVKTCRNSSLGRPNIYSEFKVNPASSGRGVVVSFTLPSGSHRFLAWRSNKLVTYDAPDAVAGPRRNIIFYQEFEIPGTENCSFSQRPGSFRLYKKQRTCRQCASKPTVTYASVKRTGAVVAVKVGLVGPRGGRREHPGGANAEVVICRKCRQRARDTCRRSRGRCPGKPTCRKFETFNNIATLFWIEPHR